MRKIENFWRNKKIQRGLKIEEKIKIEEIKENEDNQKEKFM